MGNLSSNDRSAEIKQLKLNIIELETNLECVIQKQTYSKNKDLEIQKKFLTGLLKKQKDALQKLQLLNVTEHTAQSMYSSNEMNEDFEDALEKISNKVGSLPLNDDEEDDDNENNNEGNASFPLPASHDLLNIETRIMRLNSVEKRLEELENEINNEKRLEELAIERDETKIVS